MAVTVHATFDGQVFRPEESLSLEPNKRYRLTVEEDASPVSSLDQEVPTYPLSALLDVAADLGVADLADRHGYYARRCADGKTSWRAPVTRRGARS